MKKVFSLVASVAVMAIVACGPSAAEKEAAEKAKQDSITAAEEATKAAEEAAAAPADSAAATDSAAAPAAEAAPAEAK
jgi:hypothetical protein